MSGQSQAHPEWRDLRTLTGSAEFVPAALDRMLTATTVDDATAAYWELDNRVVVQGQLFSAAERLAQETVARICGRDYTDAGLSRAVDLLVELAYGEPDQSELELGNDDLGQRCREQIVVGLNCIKALASSDDERTLLGMLDLVDHLDVDTASKTEFLSALPGRNWPDEALDRLREIR